MIDNYCECGKNHFHTPTTILLDKSTCECGRMYLGGVWRFVTVDDFSPVTTSEADNG